MMHFIKHPDPNNQYDNSKVVVETSEIVLQDVLQDFTQFLRACGFVLDGLEVVDAEEI